MKNRVIKLIICIAIVSSFMVGFCISFASAEPAIVTRVKAGVAAAMLASQLVLNPVDVALSEPLASAVDPEGRLEWVETFPEYLERSKIRVYPDVVTIDGVSYTDIWLGPDAADSLRLKGLDFATAYNIASNQSSAIEYASGAGYFASIPLYNVSGSIKSPTYYINSYGSYATGDITVNLVDLNSTYLTSTSSYNGSTCFSHGNIYKSQTPFPVPLDYTFNRSNYIVTQNLYYTGTSSGSAAYITRFPYNLTPFSFDYTSGVIDAPIAEDDGLLMRIPSYYTDPDPQVTEHNYDIHDLINIYPSVATPQGHEVEINPELNPDFQTDIDLGNGIGDLIRTILTLLDVLDNVEIQFAPEPETPGPSPVDPDPAVPDTPVGEQDGTWLDELLRWIKQAIDTISQSVIDAKDAIINEIQDLSEVIQSIPEQILEDIETGPSKVFRKALDVLKSLFLPLLLPIKAMMGLWHYVVEWLASINAPFLWIFGVMTGTSANLVLPIYAVLAGSICIAIYKALGR